MNAPRAELVHGKERPGIVAVEGLSDEILGYLAQDSDRMMRFFEATGFTPQSIRHASRLPDFAASMVEYLASDDRLLLAFAATTGRDPAEIEGIRQSLTPPPSDDP